MERQSQSERNSKAVVRGKVLYPKSTSRVLDKTKITIFTLVGNSKSFLRFESPGEIPTFKNKERVRVTGHFENRNVRVGNGKQVKKQVLILDSIAPEKTLVESVFGKDGNFFPEMESVAYVVGSITDVKNDGEWYRLTIDSEGTSLKVSVKKGTKPVDLTVGKTIYAVCSILGGEKESTSDPDKKRYYTDIVVSDMCIE